MEDHARYTNPAIRKVESEVDATTKKLLHKFGEGHGPLPDEEIADVVRDETEDLRDAPVQAFTSLIAETTHGTAYRNSRTRPIADTDLPNMVADLSADGTRDVVRTRAFLLASNSTTANRPGSPEDTSMGTVWDDGGQRVLGRVDGVVDCAAVANALFGVTSA
jgi:enhancing lycopene biosynthesis protein 2